MSWGDEKYHRVATAILLSSDYKVIELLTYVEYLFAQGRKGFRQWAKALWFYSLAIEAWQLSVYNTLSVLSLFF